MSTITKEQLRERAREKVKSLEFSITQTAFANTRAELEEELELARIALASLEAEAVTPSDVTGPLAHAYKELTPTFMRNHIGVFERYGIYPDGSAGIQAMRIALDVMERRAAMLQGADGNSPVIPDGWVACSERMPEREIDVQVYCSDKKEQMVGYMERNERDGYFRFASLPNGGGVYCQPSHWMPLPAVPQQEV